MEFAGRARFVSEWGNVHSLAKVVGSASVLQNQKRKHTRPVHVNNSVCFKGCVAGLAVMLVCVHCMPWFVHLGHLLKLVRCTV